MNTYKVSYLEDFFTIIEETEITCTDDEIKELADKYYEENQERLADVVGVNWEVKNE